MTRPRPQPAPDYTNAFLAMCYLILVMGLMVIWGVWGYVVALVLCVALRQGIVWLDRRLERAE
ncbi:histidinol phosphate aminotransferase [Jannaschia sp. LMIT008]|uniref:histidinol phosphate aminotransferase n=1 Tax=Jannaschia maritima TaxID=3032585 RepID=UPI0028114078|nr:histidinol phosphate aminotransferase [Jannaschia sp. LMIT008]